ncbi:MAG: esterase family protein [Pirellulales bacterium]|nr:esterase family protein [Pirellulales bacterium]
MIAAAQKVQLKDGRILQGRMTNVAGVAKNPVAIRAEKEPNQSTPILMIDDQLRRVYVPKHFLANVLDEAAGTRVRISLPWQNVSKSVGTIGSVGPSLGITPFDQWGRRTYNMQTKDGPLAIVQGITVLTPRYVKIEGLRGQPRSPTWDMRMATSSIPRDTLARILSNAVSHDDPQEWLQVVRFYLQAERYREARLELEAILRRFPEMKELAAEARELKKMGADRILKEVQLRRVAGQHALVTALLDNFPPEEVAGETLQQVREMTAEYAAGDARLQAVKETLRTLADAVSDVDHRRLIQPLAQEILTDLTHNNSNRLAPFAQLIDDTSLSTEEKVALATSGWILGADGASQKISVAISLVQVRNWVRRYLRESLAHERITLLESIRSAEGASIENIARLLSHMRPPWDIPEQAVLGHGAYELSAPGQSENGDFRYLVQLPPEYDAYRRYPTIVALNGDYNTPLQELTFWTGAHQVDEAGEVTGPRRGQAMRHGFITISIDWQKPQQHDYEYSLREHEAVLTSLRDAMRRFSIDTDRVYLTGHSTGGDAAWDLALSHPDVWAGVLPFVAQFSQVKKYVQHYGVNAQFVPLYFVAGEKDGKIMVNNAAVLDKYFLKRFDTTVVEFLGRGHESFHDEILEAFAWMNLPNHRRRGPPEVFACKTMRPWDNFFWWIEGRDFPGTVHPASWPVRGARPTQIYGRRLQDNNLLVKTASAQTTFWLSPDVVDFSKPIRITLNGRRLTRASTTIGPDLAVLLEDVRQRGDRHRPFWAKLQVP